MPASSDICANRLLSGQLPDQRSGTSVTARPEEQLGPNSPICSLLLEYIDLRDCSEASRVELGACTVYDLVGLTLLYALRAGFQPALWLIQSRAHPRHNVGRRVGQLADQLLHLLAGHRIDLKPDLLRIGAG